MISKRCRALRFNFLFSFLCLLTGCAPQEKTRHSQTIHLNLADDPVSLDPREVRCVRDLTVVKQLFDGLTRIDANGIPQPALAERIEISSDRMTYTFHLRQAYWNNGDPITADDFFRSWKKVLDPTFLADYAYLFFPIKNAELYYAGYPVTLGFQALDEKTFVVELETPISYLLELTAFPSFYPVHALGTTVFSGPFQLKKWVPNRELTLEKNPDYWDQEHVKLDSIVLWNLPDTHTEGILFEKGEIDWLGQPISQAISPEIFEKMKEKGTIHSYPIAGTCWLTFNTKEEPFNDPRLRKALSYAIDRQEIISFILRGDQKVATGLLPPCMGLSALPYFKDGDQEMAKQLFEEVMRERNGMAFPPITLSFPSRERCSKLAQFLKEKWKQTLGLDIKIQSIENQTYRKKLRCGEFQIGTGEWIADFNDPSAFLELFRYGMNDTGWQNARYTTLLNTSSAEGEEEKRRRMLQEAEKILMEEMPIAPLYHYSFDYAKKDEIQGVLLSPLGIADFKYAQLR